MERMLMIPIERADRLREKMKDLLLLWNPGDDLTEIEKLGLEIATIGVSDMDTYGKVVNHET